MVDNLFLIVFIPTTDMNKLHWVPHPPLFSHFSWPITFLYSFQKCRYDGIKRRASLGWLSALEGIRSVRCKGRGGRFAVRSTIWLLVWFSEWYTDPPSHIADESVHNNMFSASFEMETAIPLDEFLLQLFSQSRYRCFLVCFHRLKEWREKKVEIQSNAPILVLFKMGCNRLFFQRTF